MKFNKIQSKTEVHYAKTYAYYQDAVKDNVGLYV